MAIEDNHNHFCIYCGSRIDSNQKFCSSCGKPVFRQEKATEKLPSKYETKISELEEEYDIKQLKAKELVTRIFEPNHPAYEKFNSSIIKSNNLFNAQLEVAKKMCELNVSDSDLVENEINSKIQVLEKFIDKMEELINELVIHLSSNKQDNDDVNALFENMDDLIKSVKDY